MRGSNLFVLMLIFSFFVSGNLSANLTFSNRSSAIAIKGSNSKLKLNNVSKVSGWSQESIVKDFGHNSPSSWVEGYSNGVVIAQSGGTNIPSSNLVYSNSYAIAYGIRGNSNAILYLESIIRTDSNAFAYGIRNNSNAIVNGGGSSALSIHNSNAILYLGDVVRTDSNAFAYGIRNNSNTIVYLNDKINTSTISIPAIVQRITNNSNAIIWLDKEMQTIDHGPNNITINTATYTMLYDYFLSDDHMLDIQGSCEFDGGGHFMHFAQDNANVLRITAASNVVLKNVVLKNFNDTAVQLGAGATLTFGDGVIVQLNDEQTVSRPWIFDGDTAINGFGNTLNLGFQNIQIMQGGNLTIQNSSIQGLFENNLRCVGNASITLKDSNLHTDRDYSFTSGSFEIAGDVVLSGTSTFNYLTNRQSIIDSSSAFILIGGIRFNYAPITDNRDLIAMQDATSNLYLRGCEINSSTTGMRLTKGTLFVEDKNFFLNTGATSLSEGICFGNGTFEDNLSLSILPGASIEVVDGILDVNSAPAIACD